jgi:hypothetical protein
MPPNINYQYIKEGEVADLLRKSDPYATALRSSATLVTPPLRDPPKVETVSIDSNFLSYHEFGRENSIHFE